MAVTIIHNAQSQPPYCGKPSGCIVASVFPLGTDQSTKGHTTHGLSLIVTPVSKFREFLSLSLTVLSRIDTFRQTTRVIGAAITQLGYRQQL